MRRPVPTCRRRVVTHPPAGIGSLTLNSRLAINVTSIEALTLDALGGDDSASIVSGGAYTSGILVIGGDNGTGSDLVTIVMWDSDSLDAAAKRRDGTLLHPVPLAVR